MSHWAAVDFIWMLLRRALRHSRSSEFASTEAIRRSCLQFPVANAGDAVVTVALDDGARVAKKKLSELTIGDRVQVVDTFGKPAFDDVWFFAHREAEGELICAPTADNTPVPVQNRCCRGSAALQSLFLSRRCNALLGKHRPAATCDEQRHL